MAVYGYRYYDPATGRWPSRDPIGEVGGPVWFESYEMYLILDKELRDLGVRYLTNSKLFEVIENMRSILLGSLFEPTENIGDINLYSFITNDPKNYYDYLGLTAHGNQCSEEFKDWTKEDLEERYKELGKGKRTKEEKAQRQRIKKEQKGRKIRPSRQGGGGAGKLGLLFFLFDLGDFMENDGKLPDSDGDKTPDAWDPDPKDPENPPPCKC